MMVTPKKWRIIATLCCLVLVFQILPARADGPLTLEGTFTNADYRIRVPEDWNGTLLVYAHGYTPVLLAAEGAPGGIGVEDFLLAQGYAVAGSAYRNSGWAVKEGIQNTLALTNFFRGQVGNPDRIILWGTSMGSVITLKSIEKYPGIYDGAIAGCAVGAGTPEAGDWFLALGLAYDVTLGWPDAWGTVGDVRDDLNFEQEVVPVLFSQVTNPANFGLFEFIRLVNDMPVEDFYSGHNWLFTDMFFATQAMGELEQRAGGPVTQNLDHVYRLDAAEKAYLAGLGVDAEGLLAAMNGRTIIEARQSARHYVTRYADFSGDLKRPVLTIHTTIDGLLMASQENLYRETVAAAGKEDLLVQVYTEAVGHCTFTPEQLLATVSAMDTWLDSGMQPDPTFFPAGLGFVPGFEPPAWPY